ncbi:SDR family oxidoreductase [Siphonobacter aquaeclarae]|uniref:3-oxoacyl-[acyl-carrier protein] reductase n=1 Tax=Siphonobacter aquaeclarae TaxID=563176 RepID=A0A1G9PYH4_9BACT|nr:SDR family oxidoreductase [Siphonobacter aquaeclarae]SDM03828.1 3-oxoacyl-[acyl-carrier protein] reductase [Siphonobacter aquaeclarae]
MNLQEAKVLITGGSSGIGLETARQLVAAGAQVAICGRHYDRLQRAAAETGALPIHADVSREEEVKGMFQTVLETFGDLNVVLNNAAYGYFSPLAEIERHKFEEQIATNITGAMLVGREAARYFTEKQYGNLINIASTAGLHGFANGTAYVASKFALRGMTECWRQELRKHNVRVTLINPSEVQTSFGVNAGREAKDYDPSKMEATEIAQVILSVLQLRDVAFVTETTVFATNPAS